MSKGQCVPYTPLHYTPLLWAQHMAVFTAPAPAPEIAPRAGVTQAPVSAPSAAPPQPLLPAPGVPLRQAPVPAEADWELALGTAPEPSVGVAGRTAEVESAQAAADAMPPVAKVSTGQSGQHVWPVWGCLCSQLHLTLSK